VLLLDDPFSALDPVRQRKVMERLSDRGQVFVSVADDSHVPVGSALVLGVSAGRVSEPTRNPATGSGGG
jgi:recombinational DNA repair ATPase RecF